MQLNVIWVMIERELKLFFSSKSRVFATLFFPIILTFILKVTVGSNEILGISMDKVVITGIIISAIAVYSLFSGMSIIWERKIGFMKELLISPVNKFYLLIGKIMGISIISLIIGFVIIITNPIPLNFGVIIFMFLTSFVFTPLGIYLGFRSKDFEDFSNLVYILLVPLILFAGVLTPLSSIKDPFKILFYLDFLTYPLDGLRYFVMGKNVFNPWIDFFVCIFLGFIFLFLARKEFEISEERV